MKLTYILTVSLTLIWFTTQGQWINNGDNSTTGKIGIGGIPVYDLDISKQLPYLRIHSTSYSVGPTSLERKGGIIFNQENSDKTAGLLFAVPPGYHVPGILFATKTAWNMPGSGATDWYERAFIHPNGNFGIGTVSPENTLHINGSVRIDGNSTLPTNANANNTNNYVNNYNLRLLSANNGFYISMSNISNDRRVYLQSGHNDSGYAYGVGSICINPFGGDVGIGTTNPNQKLTVNGTIYGKEVKVDLNVPGPDYVFEPTYNLPSLTEIETYIKANKHLPEVPSAKEMEANGINLSEMNMLLLKKVEELTLHIIRQEKRISELELKQK
jgi:hypothetical protein